MIVKIDYTKEVTMSNDKQSTKAEITITQIDEYSIEMLGKKYYSEKYCEIMTSRAYQEGLTKGQTIHIAEVQWSGTSSVTLPNTSTNVCGQENSMSLINNNK